MGRGKQNSKQRVFRGLVGSDTDGDRSQEEEPAGGGGIMNSDL